MPTLLRIDRYWMLAPRSFADVWNAMLLCGEIDPDMTAAGLSDRAVAALLRSTVVWG